LLIDKQNRELKDKIVELEELAKGRSKTVIANLEAKLASIEEQLHLESNEKQRVTREFKKNEKRLRDLQAQIEEERKQTENYKEQVSDRSQPLSNTTKNHVSFLNPNLHKSL
jgi:chromosome segregation ATPase